MGFWECKPDFPTCKIQMSFAAPLPDGWKITLNDTPRNPITGTDTVINKHRGQSPSCHFPAVQKQHKQRAEMKFLLQAHGNCPHVQRLSEESWDSRLFFLFILLATLEVLWVIPSSQAPPNTRFGSLGAEREKIKQTSECNLSG